ncbi:hypothetical protein MKI85_10485 [Acinetobacter sp. A7.4]|nr:hypothetical protein [Acinetobacter sp. A7.4]MCJ8161983.1 hypothetical protein [Acinetobacter sp. A7.4]
MVAERKRVDRLATKKPARASASPFRPTATKRGTNGFPTRKIKFRILSLLLGLSKPTGDVGQRYKLNSRVQDRQVST